MKMQMLCLQCKHEWLGAHDDEECPECKKRKFEREMAIAIKIMEEHKDVFERLAKE